MDSIFVQSQEKVSLVRLDMKMSVEELCKITATDRIYHFGVRLPMSATLASLGLPTGHCVQTARQQYGVISSRGTPVDLSLVSGRVLVVQHGASFMLITFTGSMTVESIAAVVSAKLVAHGYDPVVDLCHFGVQLPVKSTLFELDIRPLTLLQNGKPDRYEVLGSSLPDIPTVTPDAARMVALDLLRAGAVKRARKLRLL